MSNRYTRNADANSLQFSPQKFHDILLHAPLGFFISTPEGTFLEANYTVARIYGYESPKSLIDSMEDIAVQIFANPRDREDFKNILEQHNTIEGYEVRQCRKDGSLVWTSISARVVRDQVGNSVNYEGFVTDISERKRMEDCWQQTFDDLPDLIAIIDRDHRILRANRAMADRLNSSPGALQGRYCYEVVHGLTGPPDFCPHARTLKSGKMESEEVFEEFLEGIFDITTTPLRDAEGQMTGSVHLARDITERKHTERALRESEKKYRLLTEQITDTVWTLDMNMRPTYVSPSSTAVLGVTPEERLHQHLSEMVTPETYSRVMGLLAQEMEREREGNADPERTVTIEMEYYHKEGHIVWLENRLRAIRDSDDRIIGLHGVSRDITERKKIERALRASEERFRALSDNLPALVCEFLPDSTLTFVNKAYCEYFGSSGEELLGQKFLELIPEEEREMVKQHYRSLTVEQPVIVYSHETIKDGKVLWQEWRSRAIFDRHGKALRFQSIGTDVTLYRQMEGDLNNSVERIRRTLGATVHAMAATVEARDPYTAGHQRRVADLARSIATEMGLTYDQIDGIRIAGTIHDLGKISVPAELLNKPGRLTELEFGLVKMHVNAGYTILKEIDFAQPVARMVHEHHERIDGSGYPRGLKGDETIVESRILAVADVVEAMASHRPYRPALGVNAALEEIGKNRGILYDADVADACLRVFREKGYQLPDV